MPHCSIYAGLQDIVPLTIRAPPSSPSYQVRPSNLHDIMPSLFKTPTSTITMVPFNARVPIDVFNVVLSYVNGVATLRSCALVCSSWHLHIRPYLFRRIVYRPAIPSRTFKDLEVFLSTLPEPGRFLRSVTIDGLVEGGGRRIELPVEEILEQLAQLPMVTHITLKNLKLARHHASPAAASISDVASPKLTRPIGRAVKELQVRECLFLRYGVPFLHFLSHFKSIDALTLKRVVVESPRESELAELPPCRVQLGSVFFSGVHATGSNRVLGRIFDGFDAQTSSSPPSVALTLYGGMVDRTLGDLVAPIRRHVRMLSVNVLVATCSITRIIVDQAHYPLPAHYSDMPMEQLSRLSLDEFSSLHTLVLYSTTTNTLRGESATVLYGAVLANNWKVLSQVPVQKLRRVELRFQLYGIHRRDTIDELRAVDWETVDAGMLARFPCLESLVCVLCDGGFLEQWEPLEVTPAAISRPVHGLQAEFDDYVALLEAALPRLHAAGLLHFRMSEV